MKSIHVNIWPVWSFDGWTLVNAPAFFLNETIFRTFLEPVYFQWSLSGSFRGMLFELDFYYFFFSFSFFSFSFFSLLKSSISFLKFLLLLKEVFFDLIIRFTPFFIDQTGVNRTTFFGRIFLLFYYFFLYFLHFFPSSSFLAEFHFKLVVFSFSSFLLFPSSTFLLLFHSWNFIKWTQ